MYTFAKIVNTSRFAENIYEMTSDCGFLLAYENILKTEYICVYIYLNIRYVCFEKYMQTYVYDFDI